MEKKSIKGVIPTNILIFIIGLILVIVHNFDNLMDFMIVIVGIIFLIPSMYSLLATLFSKKPSTYCKLTSSLITSLGAIFMGAFMMINPEVFKGILAYIFIALMIVGGVFHLFYLLKDIREVKYPIWFFALPIMMIVAGLVSMFTSLLENESAIVLITGIVFIAFALNSFIELWTLRTIAKTKEELENKKIEE